VIAPLAAGVLVLALPRPEELTPQAWRYLALFVAVIVSLVTDAVPGAVAGLAGITLATVFDLAVADPAASIRWALTGFADTTVWLMFVAFMFALG
jgi:L-tartrate/succinate antiporter